MRPSTRSVRAAAISLLWALVVVPHAWTQSLAGGRAGVSLAVQNDSEPFRLDLPGRDARSQRLPAALRPMEVVRPFLPHEIAVEVAELESKISAIQDSWFHAEDRESQNNELDKAIGAAERVLALRVKHQGNVPRGRMSTEPDSSRQLGPRDRAVPSERQRPSRVRRAPADRDRVRGAQERYEIVRWRDSSGEASDWHEIIEAREWVNRLKLIRDMGESDRAVIAGLRGMASNVESLRYHGRYTEALELAEQQLEACVQVLGDQHPDTFAAMNAVGVVLQLQGRFTEAEPYAREVLDYARIRWGSDHPDTLSSMNNMGRLLGFQGKTSESLSYFFEALQGCRRVLGDDDPATLAIIDNLGLALNSIGRRVESEQFLFAALDARRRVLGDEHLDTLSSVNNIGIMFATQEKYAEAESYLRGSLDGRRRVLGNDHPETLQSIANVAFVLGSQGKLAEAEAYYRRALEGRRRVLGDDHSYTVATLRNIGILLELQGKHADAAYYLQKADR